MENNNSGEASLRDDRSLKDKTRVDDSRQDQRSRAIELRKMIVKAFENAKSSFIPDTGYVEVWLRQGYDPSVILAVVSHGVTRNPSIRSLKYFDAAMWEAHNKCTPVAMKPAETNWDGAIASYKATGNWPRWAPGAEPGMAGCRAPSEILSKHGLGAAQEETPQEAAKVGGQ